MHNQHLSLIYNKNLQSVISDGCDLRTAFSRVLNYFDPYKNKNKKAYVLDCSYSHMWTEQDLRMFSISKTKNIKGSVSSQKYNIILYEPPRNQNFYRDAINSSKAFSKLLYPDGTLIVKMNDFKEKGKKELRGSFDIWDIFSDEGLYLHDNVVYNFNRPYNNSVFESNNRTEIVHLYFMVFRKKTKHETGA